MHIWFPSNATVSFLPSDVEGDKKKIGQPRARLLCFHGAGSDASIFTSKGTPKRPLANPLLSYCKDNDIQLLTVHMPGRTTRMKEPLISTVEEAAETVLNVLEPLLTVSKTPSERSFELDDNIPLLVAGHSLGAFIAFEFLCLMRKRGLPSAKHIFLSCMVSPDTPVEQRPWKPTKDLNTEELQEECREWGINKEVFIPEMWAMYEPVMRADMGAATDYHLADIKNSPGPNGASATSTVAKKFASSRQSSTGTSLSTTPTNSPLQRASISQGYQAPLGVSTTVFYAANDNRVSESHVKKWKNIVIGSGFFFSSPNGSGSAKSNAEFRIVQIPGAHNFFYESDARAKWMETVIGVLDKVLIDTEYGF